MYALIQEDKSVSYIAKKLNRSRTTIYNELKRGNTIQIENKKKVEVYLPDKEQLVYEQNRKKSRKPLKIHKCSKEFLKYVEDSIKQGLREILKEYEEKKGEVSKSITLDNGSKFSDMKEFEKETNTYYAHPYSAYEIGTNERHNGLLRMFIPKGKEISKYHQENIQEYAGKMNAKPRKILKYNKPEELFDKELEELYRVK